MNLFGIGPFELVLVIILALIFIGPEELPKAARALGKAFYEIQHMTEPYREEFQRAMGPIDEVRQALAQSVTGAPEPPPNNAGLPPPDNTGLPPPNTDLKPVNPPSLAPSAHVSDTTNDLAQ